MAADPKIDDALRAGLNARAFGVCEASNPHKIGSTEHVAWNCGWRIQDRVADLSVQQSAGRLDPTS